MNIQTMMKLAAQHAEEQKKANDANQLMETLRLMIMTTTINDLVNDDAIDKTLQRSADKVLQSFKNDCKASSENFEQFEAVVNLARVEVKRTLSESAKIVRVKQ